MEYTISLTPSCFLPECKMIVKVPKERNAEEYIDEYLDAILSEDLKYNCEWEFA